LLLCLEPTHHVCHCILGALLEHVSTQALQQVLGGLWAARKTAGFRSVPGTRMVHAWLAVLSQDSIVQRC
jgi:hypothetical protein